MSAEKKIDAVQAQIQTPALNDLNPLLSNDPLVQTLAKGEVPSNAILNDAIDKAKTGIMTGKAEADLNTRGEVLARDATDILDTAQRFLNEKNQGENIQHFITHASQASGVAGREANTALSSMSNMLSNALGLNTLLKKDVYTAKRDADTAYDNVRELFLFTVQSKEFRLFLIDLINFFQSTLTNAADKVNLIGDSLKADVAAKNSNLTSTSNAATAAAEQTKIDARATVAQWNEQTKREYYSRFQSLLNRISAKPEYKRLLTIYFKWMNDLKLRASQVADAVKDKASQVASQAQTSANRLANHSAWDALWVDVRGAVDGFVGAGSFDTLYGELWDLYLAVIKDKEANAYLETLKGFVDEAVSNPSSLDLDAKKKEGESLLERGRAIFEKPRYSRKVNLISATLEDYLNKIANDKLSNELSDKFKKFAEDFALDAQGRPDLNIMSDSLVQVKNLVFPLLQKQLSAVTVARIVGTTETLDWAVENALISIPDLVPEIVTLRTKNLLSLNVKQMETRKNVTKITLEILNIKPVFKHMKFWYQKKTFPTIEDYGVADIDLSKGSGALLKINWKVKSEQNKPFAFSLMDIKCVIDSLDVKIIEAKHSFFDRIALSLFAATVRQQVATSIVNSLVDALGPINDQMNAWFATRPAATFYNRANTTLQAAYNSANLALKDRPLEKASELATELKYKAVDAANYVKDNAAATLSNLSAQAEGTLQAAKEIVTERAAEAKEFVQKEMPEVSKAVADLKIDATNAAVKVEKTATQAIDSSSPFGWYSADRVEAASTVVVVEPTRVVEPAVTFVHPAATIAQPAVTIVQPAVTIAQPAVTIVQPATKIVETVETVKTVGTIETVGIVRSDSGDDWDSHWEKKSGRRNKRKSAKKAVVDQYAPVTGI